VLAMPLRYSARILLPSPPYSGERGGGEGEVSARAPRPLTLTSPPGVPGERGHTREACPPSLIGSLAFSYGTRPGSASQLPPACPAIVRSLENFPEPATFKVALRAQPSASAYKSTRRWSASRYDFKSARCL